MRDVLGSEAAVWQSRTPRAGFETADAAEVAPILTRAPAVLCLWGAVPGQGSDLDANVTLAQAALDAAASAGAGLVFLASSAAIYGRRSDGLTEDAAPTPIAPYGAAKARMEEMALAHPHPSCILRIGNVAGADAILDGWRPDMALDADGGRTPARSYIGPARLAQTLAALLRLPDPPRVLNVAAPGAVEMGALLDAAELPWTPRAASADVIWRVALDTERIEALVSFAPHDSTAAGIVQDWRAWRAMR